MSIRYSPVSIIAALCGSIVQGMVANNPTIVATVGAAAIGTAATAVVGGIELDEDTELLRNKLVRSIEICWDTICNKYDLKQEAILELQKELFINERTIDYYYRSGIDDTLVFIIQSILEKYQDTSWLNDNSDAPEAIKNILIDTIKSTVDENDIFKLYVRIGEIERKIEIESNRIIRTVTTSVKEEADRIIYQFDKRLDTYSFYADAPTALTMIPSPVELVGRKDDINSILELIKDNSIIFLRAQGGIGKTALAATICNYYKKEIENNKNSKIKHVAWICSSGDLFKDLRGLNIPYKERSQHVEENVISWLTNKNNATFLVVDDLNLSLSAKEKELLNTIAGENKILITTRLNLGCFKDYPLNTLNEESSIKLFYRYYPIPDNNKLVPFSEISDRADFEVVREIVASSYYNTLLIELVAKMASSEPFDLFELWKILLRRNILNKDSSIPLENPHASSHGYNLEEDDSLTLQEQIRRLYELSNISDSQAEIMTFFSAFPAGTRIQQRIVVWCEYSPKDINWLLKKGWIEKNEYSYSLHPLVRDSVRLQRSISDYCFIILKHKALIENLSKTRKNIKNGFFSPFITEQLVVPDTICEILSNSNIQDHLTASLFYYIAELHLRSGNYYRALELYERTNRIEGEHSLIGALSRVGSGHAYKNIGDYISAEKHFTEAITRLEKMKLRGWPAIASINNELGQIKLITGDYQESINYYEKALNCFEKDSKHVVLAQLYVNIARARRKQEEYSSAIQSFQMAYNIYNSLFGKNHPYTIAVKQEERDTYYRANPFIDDSENKNSSDSNYQMIKLFLDEIEKDVESKESQATYGIKDYVRLSSSIMDYYRELIKLVKFYEDQEEITDEQANRAIVIIANLIKSVISLKGANFPGLANLYNGIADLLVDNKRYAEALKYREKALSNLIENRRKTHISVITTYKKTAYLYQVLGNYTKAIDYYNKSIELYKDISSEDIISASCYYHLAKIYLKLKSNEKALENCEAALLILNNLYQKPQRSIAITQRLMGDIYKEKGENSQAIKCYTIALDILQKTEQPNSLYLGTTYFKISNIMDEMAQYDDAIEFRDKGVNCIIASTGQSSKLTIGAISKVGDLYYKKGNYSLAIDKYMEAIRHNDGMANSYNCWLNAEILKKASMASLKENKIDESIEYATQALNDYISARGPNDVSVITARCNLARILHRNKEFDRALQEYEYVLKMMNKDGVRFSSLYEMVYWNMGAIYYSKQQYKDAINMYYRACNRCKQIKGDKDPNLVVYYYSIGAAFYKIWTVKSS